MIKLAERDFNIATINILKDLKKNVNIINKGMKTFKSKRNSRADKFNI